MEDDNLNKEIRDNEMEDDRLNEIIIEKLDKNIEKQLENKIDEKIEDTNNSKNINNTFENHNLIDPLNYIENTNTKKKKKKVKYKNNFKTNKIYRKKRVLIKIPKSKKEKH